MKRFSLMFVLLVGMLLLAGSAQAAVVRIVVVETADVPAYKAEVDKLQAHMARLGSKATIRVWRARFAGPEAGAVVVAVEYADLATMAADEAKSNADAEFAATLARINAMRKIVSDSLYEELD